jgi:hypothetical protein
MSDVISVIDKLFDAIGDVVGAVEARTYAKNLETELSRYHEMDDLKTDEIKRQSLVIEEQAKIIARITNGE